MSESVETRPPETMPPAMAADETGLASASVRRKASRGLILFLQIVTFVALMTVWQVLSAMQILDPFFFSRPSDIALRIVDWLVSGFIWEHLAVTLIEALLAFAIGTLLGVVLGLAFARVELIAAVFDPYIRIFNALPRVILAPIFLLWFGLGIASKVALGVTLVFFVVFFNTYQGVREVDHVILNNARMLQATDRQLLRHVYLPSAMAWIFSSLHTSIGFALVGAVVGEFLGSRQGIGLLIATAQGAFNAAGVFAAMIVLAVVALGAEFLLTRLEDLLLKWRPQQFADSGL